MEKKILVVHMPVIHKGYLDFLEKISNKASDIYIIDENFLEELSDFKPDIASIDSFAVKDILNKMGFSNISILTKDKAQAIKDKDIILIQDEVSRNLCDKYLDKDKVEWKSVFLRWDKRKVLSVERLEDIPVSNSEFDISMMKEASKESEKTGDWWRQIGALLVKDGKILIKACNKDLPSDHTPYQVGEVRDFFSAGEKHELANTIHAEQNIIAQAAKQGIPVDGLSMYVTTFPCPVCAKMIACSGIKYLYFKEGGSNFNAKKVLESAGVKIINIPLKD